MNRRAAYFVVLNLCLLATTRWNVARAFTSNQKVQFTASVTVGGGSNNLTIVAHELPPQTFFGKNFLIPVQVVPSSGSTISTTDLHLELVYQLLDNSGNALTPPTSLPISAATLKNNVLYGTAIIPRSQLGLIQNGGGIAYVFRATQGGGASTLGAAGVSHAPAASAGIPTLDTPFKTSIISELCQEVKPTGSRIAAPDLFTNDGETSVTFPQGSVASSGNLCLKQENVNDWPSGPGGSKAATIYTITLHDTTLTGAAQLALSYPSDTSGKVLDVGSDPGSLGLYWLDENALPRSSGVWRPLSRGDLDTTLHTLTGMTAHFSTFALFAGGALGASDLRPRERIITPNGDGINDTVSFSGLVSGEEVHLFDARGRRVRTLAGPSPVWNGTDDDGKIVESGVYIYQYTSQGDRVSGVIGVAK